MGRATRRRRGAHLLYEISIHALRGESDVDRAGGAAGHHEISIHALRGESDREGAGRWRRLTYFNPRSPWGERPVDMGHALDKALFQSTLSVGRATDVRLADTSNTYISIHALRGESDTPPTKSASGRTYFNPRSPWGERQLNGIESFEDVEFQSTLSVGRATLWA